MVTRRWVATQIREVMELVIIAIGSSSLILMVAMATRRNRDLIDRLDRKLAEHLEADPNYVEIRERTDKMG
jgi:hypothetical protein